MSSRGSKKRQKPMSKSQRANVTFPVARMKRFLKMGTHRLRIGIGGPVYMAAVIEYLTGSICINISFVNTLMINSHCFLS